MTDSIVTLKGIDKTFYRGREPIHVLEKLDLDVPTGSFEALTNLGKILVLLVVALTPWLPVIALVAAGIWWLVRQHRNRLVPTLPETPPEGGSPNGAYELRGTDGRLVLDESPPSCDDRAGRTLRRRPARRPQRRP